MYLYTITLRSKETIYRKFNGGVHALLSKLLHCTPPIFKSNITDILRDGKRIVF